MLTAKQVVIGLFVILVIAIGVATNKPLPPCDKYSFGHAMTSTGELYLVLDQENAVKLQNAVKGLSEGTCRLPE